MPGIDAGGRSLKSLRKHVKGWCISTVVLHEHNEIRLKCLDDLKGLIKLSSLDRNAL